MSKGRGPRKERRLGPESTGDSQVLGLGLQREEQALVSLLGTASSAGT